MMHNRWDIEKKTLAGASWWRIDEYTHSFIQLVLWIKPLYRECWWSYHFKPNLENSDPKWNDPKFHYFHGIWAFIYLGVWGVLQLNRGVRISDCLSHFKFLLWLTFFYISCRWQDSYTLLSTEDSNMLLSPEDSV